MTSVMAPSSQHRESAFRQFSHETPGHGGMELQTVLIPGPFFIALVSFPSWLAVHRIFLPFPSFLRTSYSDHIEEAAGYHEVQTLFASQGSKT